MLRIARSRVLAVDSFSSARSEVAARVALLPAVGKAFGYAAMAGSGFVLSLSLLRGGRRQPSAAALPVAPRPVNPWSALAVQTISVLVLPAAQAWLLGDKSRFRLPTIKMPKIHMPKMPKIPTPSELFYRWLGLEK